MQVALTLASSVCCDLKFSASLWEDGFTTCTVEEVQLFDLLRAILPTVLCLPTLSGEWRRQVLYSRVRGIPNPFLLKEKKSSDCSCSEFAVTWCGTPCSGGRRAEHVSGTRVTSLSTHTGTLHSDRDLRMSLLRSPSSSNLLRLPCTGLRCLRKAALGARKAEKSLCRSGSRLVTNTDSWLLEQDTITLHRRMRRCQGRHTLNQELISFACCFICAVLSSVAASK